MSNSDGINSILEDARGRIALIEWASSDVQADELAAEARGYIAPLREQSLIVRLQLVMLLTEADQALRDRSST